MTATSLTIDGNEAAARVAHQVSEVIAIYPITPSSPMGEHADAWSSAKRKNIFGAVPTVMEMQSEGGAAGTVHGALQTGALCTTFTASQGLLLMIPNMYKIAGELTPTVFHVAARTIATHALSIFGDHSDVMAVRQTGWALLCSATVQEAQDLALVAHAATLRSRVPFVHFFDGFRTSHEVNKIDCLETETIDALIDRECVAAHRQRGLSPDRPVLRGTAQNPDVFFQAREACNPFHDAVPAIVQEVMNELAAKTGRQYHLCEYIGSPDADRVIVLMGSGVGAAEEAIARLVAAGQKVGLLQIRLFRPFPSAAFLNALPRSVRSIAVLDRTKEPGAVGEPLYQEVVCTIEENWEESRSGQPRPKITGGRYGLSSKEFTPAMVTAIFDEMAKDQSKRHFTVGIVDDVTHLSLPWDKSPWQEDGDVLRAVFYGLGSDGTVGANKNSVKIIGEGTNLYAQGYFVYDSKKSGAMTVSHLRISPRPIRSSYLIQRANFVACHQFHFLERIDVLELAEPGATFLLSSPYGPEEVWDHLPAEAQEKIIRDKIRLFVVDAPKVAAEAGLGNRINTVMQTCFFALMKVLPTEEAIRRIKEAIRKTYGKRGDAILRCNEAAVDGALAALAEVRVANAVTAQQRRLPPIIGQSSDFVERITARILAGQGDWLPVSALPVDGTFPTSTARYEKRSIAAEIPIWDADICIQCGLCALVCPHAAIRSKSYLAEALQGKPESFVSKPWSGKDLLDYHMTIQVAPDDCTGCGVCVDVCPAHSKEVVKHKAINMAPKLEHLSAERANFDYFLSIPEINRETVKIDTIKGSQLLEPLFEFSGACAGCGETPYLKLVSQLFGDRIVIANATGCSSIYGGNLPTTPWSVNAEGRGPAWSNSLFEDNAEFGLGMRLALDQLHEVACQLLRSLATDIGSELVHPLLHAPQESETEIKAQRERVAALKQRLTQLNNANAKVLVGLADQLVRKGVWIVGGDGWAYDIGFGGLDHVLSTGRDVNILVLDTEVYSNTGGQASKATPRGAVAKFATAGKGVGKKDLGMIAMAYGNVYVAQVAMGANPLQTLRAIREAESYRGPSLIIAYSHCIAHGIDMSTAMTHQKDATASGYWPLYRYDPRSHQDTKHPFHLDSKRPTIPLKDFALKEARFAMLHRSDPATAKQLLERAQEEINERWSYYEQLAGVERAVHVAGTTEVTT